MRFSTIRDLTFQMDPLSRFVSQAACSRWLQNVLCPSPIFGVAFYANRLEACPADSWSTESCSALYNDECDKHSGLETARMFRIYRGH